VSESPRPEPQPEPDGHPSFSPQLAPIPKEPPAGGSGGRWFGLATLAVLAAGLSAAFVFKGGFKAAPAAAPAPGREVVSQPWPKAAPAPGAETTTSGVKVEFKEVPETAMLPAAPAACGQCQDTTDWSRRLGGGVMMGNLPASLDKHWDTGQEPPPLPPPAAPAASADSPDDVGAVPAAWACCPFQ
jgi:hypothetical protein